MNLKTRPHNNTRLKLSLWLALTGFIALLFADIDIHRASPGQELLRMGQGLMAPNFWSYREIASSAFNTLAFALQGMALASAPVPSTHLTLPKKRIEYRRGGPD